MSKCFFQSDWMNNPNLRWLADVPDNKTLAYCMLCKVKFSLSNMGLRAVTSHQSGKKHQMKEKSAASSKSVQNIFSAKKKIDVDQTVNTDTVTQIQTDLPVQESLTFTSVEPVNKGIQRYFLKNDVSRTEILWCMQSIMTHKSLRSAATDVSMFSKMFPDSAIAKNLQLGRDKMAYTIVYGISPFFKEVLEEELLRCEHLVIGFDESLNKVSQKQQMDLNVRYWCPDTNKVKARYLNSAFLGRTRASDLLAAFQDAAKPLDLKKLLQISMDGPNVNFKFFRELSECLKETPEDPEILNMGSCGLHSVNVAFKTGANESKWQITQFLRSLYYLFKDSPARRSLYMQYTESDVFPKKFCSVRWLENSTVAERAIAIIPKLKIFFDGVEKDRIISKSKSYVTVKNAITDNLLPAKLAFFQVISSDLESFLREYQTDQPLIPFLFSDLSNLTLRLLERFVKKDVLKNTDVLDVDLKDESNFLPYKQIDIGISTICSLKKANVSETDAVYFRKDCRNFLLSCTRKLAERSPLIYELTKAVSCFHPIVATQKSFLSRLTKLLLILCEKKWIGSALADRAKAQFQELCSQEHIILKLKAYKKTERIDEFWYKLLSSEPKTYQDALFILKIVMILSHGNGNVERGFSINIDCLWDNMQERSLVARRIVFDTITALGGLKDFEISNKMILYARNAHAKFKEASENRRKEIEKKNVAAKRKRETNLQLKELQAKKNKILEEAQKQSKQIEEEIAALRA